MEDLEQDPEELPMDEVLAEIRHILSAKLEGKNISADEHPAILSENVIHQKEPKEEISHLDYFLLTPAMRCDLPPDSELSQNVQRQTARVLTKLQQQTPANDLNPALIDWLNENLPKIIEKALDNHFKK